LRIAGKEPMRLMHGPTNRGHQMFRPAAVCFASAHRKTTFRPTASPLALTA
jgi:hypothetical protein